MSFSIFENFSVVFILKNDLLKNQIMLKRTAWKFCIECRTQKIEIFFLEPISTIFDFHQKYEKRESVGVE